MNKGFKQLGLLLLLSLSFSVMAEENVEEGVRSIQKEWAEIKYRTVESKKGEKLKALAIKAEKLSQRFPESADPLIWQAISLGTYAGAIGGLESLFESLPAVKKAKVALEKAIELNPQALKGAGLTTLGSFYYQVPGWPIAYGDKDKARKLLEKGLSANPTGVDANYFYGDFLFVEGEYEKAVKVLKKALAAPARPGRALADEGRKEEARQKLKEVEAKL
jgi:tetratricopeptide (TPR) repeat protein